MINKSNFYPTSTHWGNYRIEVSAAGAVKDVHPYQEDEEPSEIGKSLLDFADSRVRISQPMIRVGYMNNPGKKCNGGRGREPFVPVSWEVALDLAADALSHHWQTGGPNSIYGGSYGWASAGRFHHAQSQIHKFLKIGGGYVSSVNSYSAAAAEVIVKRILGFPLITLLREAPPPDEIAEHSKIVILFGGAAIKNAQINAGGLGKHSARSQLKILRDRGVRIINISPLRDDIIEELAAEWIPCRPGSDTALMLGIAYILYTEGRHNANFLKRYTVGFEKFLPYLLGDVDSQPKNAEWASELSGVPTNTIVDLARAASQNRSLVSVSWSLQRQHYGEQSWWMATVLGAMLGHIGLSGGGVGYGYGCTHNMGFGGRKIPTFRIGTFGEEVGERIAAGNQFIPVARITDMLSKPGDSFQFNGMTLQYPDIQLIYWAGGNPFHHHQDLNRLRRAWQKPQTIIVNEMVWTSTARHADIVFPVCSTMERNDIAGSAYDAFISPMKAVAKPYGCSRSDFAIFSALAARLDFEDEFTEGRQESDWVKHLYEITRLNASRQSVSLPEFDDFWKGEQIAFNEQLSDAEFRLEKFRQNPSQYPLDTPSGKIEIFSETIASFNYRDCAGHPKWYPPCEWLGGNRDRYPLHLVSNQPKHKLHSQFDYGRTSLKHKIQGREVLRMHPSDAALRDLSDCDIIRIFNDRGSCLAGLRISNEIMRGVVELPTGAWFDLLESGDYLLEIHGNPNVLTPDIGTSQLAQGCSAHTCMVEVEPYRGIVPDITVFNPPLTRT